MALAHTKTLLIGSVGIAILCLFAVYKLPDRGVERGTTLIFTQTSATEGTLEWGKETYRVQLAQTEEARTKGLSDTTHLAEDEGMLFMFEEAGMHPFWMKDMRYPLDIVWISEDWQVLGITQDARPESFPKLFLPPSPARYVLERLAR